MIVRCELGGAGIYFGAIFGFYFVIYNRMKSYNIV